MTYLDHHAATPLAPGVWEAMDAARSRAWAHPSSVHGAGRKARELVESARGALARVVAASPSDLVFTSGGTEAVNLAVLGTLDGIDRIVTSTVEHPAMASAVDFASEQGIEVIRVPVRGDRAPALDDFAPHVRHGTLLALAWVNHETGSILPIPELGLLARDRGARLAIDAVQALGKLPIEVGRLGAQTVAFSAHKVGGPPGAGALWVERGTPLSPRVVGGGQERGRRAGTPDVLAVVGFGAACDAVPDRLAAQPRLASLRDRLEAGLVARGAVVNAAAHERVATVVNASLVGQRGPVWVAALDLEGVCVSSGAACSSGLDAPSAVLLAMYPHAPERARGALRWSLGPESTEADVQRGLEALETVFSRQLAP